MKPWLCCLPLLPLAAGAAPPNPALQPIEDVPGLPRVLLIGDSISIGYTIPTRKLLEGKANVHRIPTNGGPTSNGIKHLDAWLGDSKWDVIHFNFGLHDLRLDAEGKHQVELADYQVNLRKLAEKMVATVAKVIWCTTTPVPEGDLKPPRSNDDVIAYNNAAKEALDGLDIAVDDLYSYALPQLAEIQIPVNVHFTGEGSKVLAKQVAESIRAALGIDD